MGATMSKLHIREECDTDHAVIRSITKRAFRGVPYADGDGQDVIDRLRFTNALTLSLIAVLHQEIVGHIAFSPAKVGNGSYPWFTLGPVSVLREHQYQGIGSALIEGGLTQLREMNALGCILTGNPLYYQKFGFKPVPENAPPNEPDEFFMLKLLSSQAPDGQFAFHRAFYGDI